MVLCCGVKRTALPGRANQWLTQTPLPLLIYSATSVRVNKKDVQCYLLLATGEMPKCEACKTHILLKKIARDPYSFLLLMARPICFNSKIVNL